MKASTLVAFAAAISLVSCGPWGESRQPYNKRPVLPPLVRAETASRIDFARHVRPILEQRCVWCHSEGNSGEAYLLTSREGALRNRNIVARKPNKSLLYLAASGQHPPLKDFAQGVRIAQGDLKALERWISSGAVWPTGQAGQLEAR